MNRLHFYTDTIHAPQIKYFFKTVFIPCTEDWGDIGTNQGYIPFDQSESEFFDRKLDFFIPFHNNPILDCSPNNLPLEADRSDWYLKLILDCSFHLINGFINRILNCLITWTAHQKSQGNLDRENRSTFGFYVPAGQQSDPSFDWRIQIQIGQTECTPSLIQNLKKNMRYLRCVHVECGTLCWNFAKKAVSYCSNVLHPQSNLPVAIMTHTSLWWFSTSLIIFHCILIK